MENLRSDKPGEMNTLSQVMNKLHSKGYDNELRVSDHGRMQPVEGDEIYDPEDLRIIKIYRFEGESDPSDNSVLYLIEDKNGKKATCSTRTALILRMMRQDSMNSCKRYRLKIGKNN